MSRSQLSSTSLAILGLLALRPWSAYQLTRQIHRGMRYMHPASERNLYAEPKRLAAAGLQQLRSYQADGGPFPERLHLIMLFSRFYFDYLALLHDWVALARREVASWPTTRNLGLTDGTRQILNELLRQGEQLTTDPEHLPTARRAPRSTPQQAPGADGQGPPASLPA